MNGKLKKLVAIILALLLVAAAIGCGPNISPQKEVVLKTTVTHDLKYDAANLSLSPEEFEKAGFTLGDSCDITFANGYSLLDIPYYNGYYVVDGDPLVVAYPGFNNVSITLNNIGIWEQAKLTEGESVTISLNTPGKYLAIQTILGQVYSFDRSEYPTDEAFCNFRALTGGNLKEGFLWRGASPVDNSRSRASYTDSLLEAHNINFVLDLADSETDMTEYMADKAFASPYTAGLYANNNVALLNMGSAYRSEIYAQKLASGLKTMLNSDGPIYIHCMEGKDRTGFVCMLLEALAGASYDEMRTDYMLTYSNYYGVTLEDTPDKYEAITKLYFDAFVSYLHGTDNIDELKKTDYTSDAMNYLIKGGMTKAEVNALQKMITQ